MALGPSFVRLLKFTKEIQKEGWGMGAPVPVPPTHCL